MPSEANTKRHSDAAEQWWMDYGGSLDATAVLLAFDAGMRAGRESAEADLRRLRERIGRMVEREERYRLDATQRMDDLDAASHDRAALVLRSLLTAPQAREEE